MPIAITANAYNLLFDGGLESGTLQGWISGTQGTAIVTRRASCFSNNDTRALNIRGQYAGLLRSTNYASSGQVEMFTSKQFIAGSGILFLANSEQNPAEPPSPTFALSVSIFNREGETLDTQQLVTASTRLSPKRY